MTITFGKYLRKLRLDAGIGLRELARLVEKSPGYISDVEQDNVPPPTEETLLKIAAALATDRKELLLAARKMDPELTRYIIDDPQAADFLRKAKEKHYDKEDWDKLSQLAEIAKLGKSSEDME